MVAVMCATHALALEDLGPQPFTARTVSLSSEYESQFPDAKVATTQSHKFRFPELRRLLLPKPYPRRRNRPLKF